MVEAAPDITMEDQARSLLDQNAMVAINKIDLQEVVKGLRVEGHVAWPFSVTTGAGLDSFLEALEKMIEGRVGDIETPVITRERHRSIDRGVRGMPAKIHGWIGKLLI